MALDAAGGEVLALTVAGEPDVRVGEPVAVEGLIAMPWSQGDRSGVAFRAAEIRSTGAPLPGVISLPKTTPPTSGGAGKPAA